MTTTILFYRINDPYGCLSNLSPHAIILDGSTWPTAEHYFQAQKFTDWNHRNAIRSATTPLLAARMGHARSRPLRSDWEQIKDQIMRTALWAKAHQHTDVRTTLLATGDSIIVEHTANDAYWGDGGDGSGQNKRGKLWMEIRTELTTNGPHNELAAPLLPPWLTYPDIPQGAIGWRMGGGEAYLWTWSAWYSKLPPSDKHTYHTLYPEPNTWQGFYGEDEETP